MKALIIGGGIGGLAAGIALKRAGLDVAVFERAPEFREVGAGLSLWPNAVKALDMLGVGEALRGGSLKGRSAGFHDWRGRTLCSISPVEMERRCGAPSVIVHRADLIDILADALGRGAVRFGAQCVDFLQNEQGVAGVSGQGVVARFADGSVAGGDLLVGADGLHSTVRARLFGDSPPRYSGYVAWRGVVPYDCSNLKIGEYLGRGQRFGMLPLLGGRLYWFATANRPPNEPPPADGHHGELVRRYHNWCDPIPDVLRRTDPAAILRNDIYDRDPVEKWGEGRVTLLGDAAHPTTPNLGQGACQAIEDAVELGRCISGANEPAQIPAALRQYEGRRIPRTREIVLRSRRYGQIAQSEGAIACWLRDRVVAWTPDRVQMRSMVKLVNAFA